jgi:hypothetical protein
MIDIAKLIKRGGCVEQKDGTTVMGYYTNNPEDIFEQVDYCTVDWDYFLSLIKSEDQEDIHQAVTALVEHGVIHAEVATGAHGVMIDCQSSATSFYFHMRVYAEQWLDVLLRNGIAKEAESFVYRICWRPKDDVVTSEERNAQEAGHLRSRMGFEFSGQSRRSPWNLHGD